MVNGLFPLEMCEHVFIAVYTNTSNDPTGVKDVKWHEGNEAVCASGKQ